MDHSINPEAETSQGTGRLSQSKQRFTLSRLEVIFGGLILLGLVYIGYILFFQDGSGTSPGLEKRLKNLETLSQQQAEKINLEIKALQNAQARWENRLKALETGGSKPGTAAVATAPSAPAAGSPPPVKKTLQTKVEKKPAPAGAERKKIQHKVKKGETLNSIAARYKVSSKDLVQWNKKIKNNQVRVGETLVILAR